MDCDSGLNNSPLLTLWSVHELNVFARKTIILREWIPYTNMSYKSPFGSASHFANIVSWNPGGPTSNLRRLKAFFAAVIEEQSVYCNNSWRPQLRDQTLCFSAWDGSFFCSCNEGMGVIQAQCRIGGAYCGSQGPQASGRQWRLRFHKRHGFLRQTCQTNLLSAVHHISRTWAAERLAAPLPTHGC